jgi:hypothetical protein
METTEIKDPKDEQITNADTAVTNKDGNNDLEQGAPNLQDKPDEERVPTVTPDENKGDPTAQEPEDEDTTNKGKGPKGENL